MTNLTTAPIIGIPLAFNHRRLDFFKSFPSILLASLFLTHLTRLLKNRNINLYMLRNNIHAIETMFARKDDHLLILPVDILERFP